MFSRIGTSKVSVFLKFGPCARFSSVSANAQLEQARVARAEQASSPVAVRTLTPNDIEQVVDVFTRSFVRNPFHLYAGNDHPVIYKYFNEIMPLFAETGHSVVAVNEKDQPIGAILSLDYTEKKWHDDGHHYETFYLLKVSVPIPKHRTVFSLPFHVTLSLIAM